MRRASDAGAAVVEFVLISVLLVLLLFGVLQVGVYFYARNIVAASAADAARYAAAVGVAPSAGAVRAKQLIADGLGAAQARAIRCTSRSGTDARSGLPVTTVHCVGKVRALLIATNLPLTVDFTSSALREQTP
ncbi:MAG TPA: TadE/TadG family type IV pilus assembly protein [Jatrophihabitantaceae bacterium]|nr:TadE/TadG family type IV pilus assembly protein [Jatrophihabitantaceae bacterium]